MFQSGLKNLCVKELNIPGLRDECTRNIIIFVIINKKRRGRGLDVKKILSRRRDFLLNLRYCVFVDIYFYI